MSDTSPEKLEIEFEYITRGGVGYNFTDDLSLVTWDLASVDSPGKGIRLAFPVACLAALQQQLAQMQTTLVALANGSESGMAH